MKALSLSGLLRIFLILFLCLAATSAHGHRLRIFASGTDREIIGETAFSGGRAPKNATVLVKDANTGDLLLRVPVDAQGTFRFPVPERARVQRLDLRLVVDMGGGHRGEWILPASDYLPEAVKSMPPASRPRPDIAQKPASPPFSGADPTCLSADELRRLMDEAVARQLLPLKQMLTRQAQQKPELRDILGGIGYLVGLAGLIAYYRSRRGGNQS